jgi:hypothetical protein
LGSGIPKLRSRSSNLLIDRYGMLWAAFHAFVTLDAKSSPDRVNYPLFWT